MKTNLRWALLLVAGLLAGLALSSGAPATEGQFDRTLKVTGAVELDVATGSGSVTVRSGDASTVRVHGVIRASSFFGGDEVEKRVRYLESNPPIEQHGNIIRVGHLDDPEVQRNISISYEVVVPAETRLRSGTGSGSQSVEGIRGPLDVSTGSGRIRATGIGGEVRASTGSGTIELESAKGDVHASTGSGWIRAVGVAGGFRASTGSGSVTLEQTAPGDVDVSTGSGNIDLRHVRGSLRAHAASGTITVEGEGTGTWSLNTASGSIHVRLPGQAGFDLRAHTVSGSITTDRPLTVQGTLSRRELSGRAGQGGLLLEVRTVSGNIRIE